MLYGLLAHPAGHSLSPKMQNAMMQARGINGHYQAFDVNPSDLGLAVRGLQALGAGGFNLSTPFKQAVIPYLDELSPLSRQLQAVNTVKIEDGRLLGTSTDGDGFWQSITKEVPHERVVILGTGGAARAVIATAAAYGVRELTVVNRYHANWQERQNQIQHLNEQAHLLDLANQVTLTRALAQADLLINATTVGMDGESSPLDATELASLPAHCRVIDMIYRQAKSPLLQLAQERGLTYQNGLAMLVNQGALSFEEWFGQVADRSLMQREIEE